MHPDGGRSPDRRDGNDLAAWSVDYRHAKRDGGQAEGAGKGLTAETKMKEGRKWRGEWRLERIATA